MFLRDCWYVIAWDHEIPVDGLFSRVVLSEPILVFRTADGGFTAMEDRCCHRAAPLSKGRKEGDAVRCGYHGLKFDASGACVDAPGLDRIPAQARVKTYPIVLHHKWLFVWMGDAAKADRALLPDCFSNDHPEWRNKPGYMHYPTPYLLICDNLLDFSHLTYVHESTLGGSTAIAQARAEVEEIPRGVRVTRRVPDVPPPPYYRNIRAFHGNVDRWFIYDFVFPGTLLMQSGGMPAGAEAPDPSNSVLLHSCQTLTPETETSTHYFFQQSHRTDAGTPAVTQGIYDSLVTAFHEDRAMIAAQAESLRRAPQASMLPLAMDRAVHLYRQLLSSAIAGEGGVALTDADTPSILVIEDDATAAGVMERALRNEGWIVKVVCDGREALEIIGRSPVPWLVTLDVGLPDMSGIDLILAIKDSSSWSRVPVLIVTATPRDQGDNWAVRQGARGYLVKPLKAATFLDAVRRFARAPRSVS